MPTNPYRLDLLVVKFARWDDALVERVVRECGGTVVARIPEIRWAEVEIDDAAASDTFLAFESHPEVEDVWFSMERRARAVAYSSASRDDMIPFQYGLDSMGVFEAWEALRRAGKGRGDPAVRVGVVDTGLAAQYASWPEFAGKDIVWRDLTNAPSPTPADSNGHGTSVACVAVGNADKGSGPVGVAPACSLVAARASSNGIFGDGGICSGLLAAANAGARVINLSVGGDDNIDPTQYASIYADTFTTLWNMGALVFMAAGNEGYDDRTSGMIGEPGAVGTLYNHIDVASVVAYADDKVVRYSNIGSYPNVAAPGHMDFATGRATQPCSVPVPAGWVSPWKDATAVGTTAVAYLYRAFDGTSCATPMAAGVAALILSANPSLSVAQLRSIYLSTARKPLDPDFFTNFARTDIGIPGAGAGVKTALALATPGTAYPHVRFWGRGVSTDIDVTTGVVTRRLRGAVAVEVTAFCANGDGTNDPATSVQLIARDPSTGAEDVVYSGSPRTTWDVPLVVAAARFAGKTVKVVATMASGATASEEYAEFVAYAASSTAPCTTAMPGSWSWSPGATIALSATSENPPVQTFYTWGPLLRASEGGDWHLSTGPIAQQVGALRFYSRDALGNVEGGTDYAAT